MRLHDIRNKNPFVAAKRYQIFNPAGPLGLNSWEINRIGLFSFAINQCKPTSKLGIIPGGRSYAKSKSPSELSHAECLSNWDTLLKYTSQTKFSLAIKELIQKF